MDLYVPYCAFYHYHGGSSVLLYKLIPLTHSSQFPTSILVNSYSNIRRPYTSNTMLWLRVSCYMNYPPMTHSFTGHCSFKSQCPSLGRQFVPQIKMSLLLIDYAYRKPWSQPFRFIVAPTHGTHLTHAVMPLIVAMPDMNSISYMQDIIKHKRRSNWSP